MATINIGGDAQFILLSLDPSEPFSPPLPILDGIPNYPQQPGQGPVGDGGPIFGVPSGPSGTFCPLPSGDLPTGNFDQSGPSIEAFPPLSPDSFSGSDGPAVEALSAVPEPSTMALIILGCVAAAASARFRNRSFRAS